MKTITPKELNEKINKNEEIYILDVRAEEKYKQDHIEAKNTQSINIHKEYIFHLNENGQEVLSHLPKNKEIFITCTTGNSARKCAEIPLENDYQVTLLQGGLTAWKEYLEKKENKIE